MRGVAGTSATSADEGMEMMSPPSPSGLDGGVVDEGVAAADVKIGLLGNKGLEVLVDSLPFVDFVEEAATFGGELGVAGR